VVTCEHNNEPSGSIQYEELLH